MKNIISFLLFTGVAAFAQDSLSLEQAVHQALEAHPSQQAAAAEVAAAEARVEQARTGYLPRARYTESFQSSNQPVFAFGTLLNQRRFTQSNFAVNALNHPGFVNNFQSQASVEQTLYDFGATNSGIRSSEISKEMTQEQQRLTSQQRIAQVAQAYHRVTLAEQAREVAEAAVRSAEADLERAEAVNEAGMSTDADVLSIRVHLASMREQEIQRRYDADVALAALNEAMGAPLDETHQLATPLTAPADIDADIDAQPGIRPEVRQAKLAQDLGEARRESARKAYLPKIVARGVFEANRGRFINQGGANWFFGVGLEWNVFDGSTKRKVQEAEASVAVARARTRQVAGQVSLQLRQARANLAASREKLNVAEASVAEAEESTRIIRNRYEAGVATVDVLLRNEVALMEAQTRTLEAIYDERMAAIAVELAAGTLTEDSNVLD